VHTFASPLQRAAAVAGGRTAVVCGSTTLTYAETADFEFASEMAEGAATGRA